MPLFDRVVRSVGFIIIMRLYFSQRPSLGQEAFNAFR